MAADVPLNGTADPETVTLTLKNEFAGEAADSEYRIQVRKAQPVLFTPQLTPSDALLFVCDMLFRNARLAGCRAVHMNCLTALPTDIC